MDNSKAGFREIEHTADWELAVWAPDLAGFLEQAALGMYALSETRLELEPRCVTECVFPSSDREVLLVSFLSELLWLGEQKGLAFDTFLFTFQGESLLARLEGAAIASQVKEIKAVTYHNLNVRQTEKGFEASVIFDV